MNLCIGEKIYNSYSVLIVAISENLDEYIKVSSVDVLCVDGTFYYNDNTAKTLSAWETLKNALTPEWAKTFIIGYHEGMRLLPVNMYSEKYDKNADKKNEKLRKKLAQMTVQDFYRKPY